MLCDWWESLFTCKMTGFVDENLSVMSRDILGGQAFLSAFVRHSVTSNVMEQSPFLFLSGSMADKIRSILLVGISIPFQNATFQQYDRRNAELISRLSEMEKDMLEQLSSEFERNALEVTENQELQRYYKLVIDRHVETINVVKTALDICGYAANIATHRWVWWPHEILAIGVFFNAIGNEMVHCVNAVASKTEGSNEIEYATDAIIDELLANLNIIYGSKKERDFMDAIYNNICQYNCVNRSYHHNCGINGASMKRDHHLSVNLLLLKAFVTLDTFDVQILKEIGYFMRHVGSYIARLKKIQHKIDKLDLTRLKLRDNYQPQSAEVIATLDETHSLFEVQPFRFSYSQEAECVLKVTTAVEVPSRAWTFFQGNSGTGKTTFVHILLGLIAPGEVDVAFFGRRRYSYGSIRDYVSVVKSKGDIFSNRSVEFNVTFGVRASPSMSEHDIRRTIVKYFAAFQLGDYDELSHKLIRHMSTGEQQRIKVIRLIVGTLSSAKKSVWIMDEVTSNVDANIEAVILKELKRIQEALGLSVIHISHNPASRDYCDYYMLIDEKKDISISPN